MSAKENRESNRLIYEKSPYLLQHAHNPVDWHPWGEEAFRRAREEDKPIFLSIGYSTCHWCHVMERESFESPEIAERMNRWFVNIKLDREERPDIDRVYMAFVQATAGSGGWPLSVWLTPELEPFYGGTYFPPRDYYGRPGFAAVLEKIAELWGHDRDALIDSSRDITGKLRAALAAARPQLLDSSVLFRAFKLFEQAYDQRDGGFGGAPKFPRPVALNFLLRYFARTGDREAARMVLATLSAMARGGMYDQLGGGFHRYSVDAFWHVPHFEKMLYDQAQLACSYLEGFQVSHEESFAEIARETIEYVLRDLTDPATGAFFSAEDADSPVEQVAEPVAQPSGCVSGSNPASVSQGTDRNPQSAFRNPQSEGAFYVWAYDQIQELLSADVAPPSSAAGPDVAPPSSAAEIFSYHYGLKPEGNADDPQGELAGKNVLHAMHTVAETAEHFSRPVEQVTELLERSRQKLREARAGRPRPHRDDKVIGAWNGLMISALARASQVLDEHRYLEAAERAARFLQATLWNEGEGLLARRYRDGQAAFEGCLEDYAFLAQGMLDLYEAGFDLRWLFFARRLTERMIELFSDSEAGGFFSTSGRDPSVLLRLKEDYDGAEPSGNSVATLNLARLADMLDRPEWRQLAEQTVQAFAGRINEHPEALPQMLVAFEHLSQAGVQIVVAGERGDQDTQALLRVVHERFLPGKVVLLADLATCAELGARLPFLQAMAPRDGRPTAYVCHHFACDRPVEQPEALRELLGRPPLAA